MRRGSRGLAHWCALATAVGAALAAGGCAAKAPRPSPPVGDSHYHPPGDAESPEARSGASEYAVATAAEAAARLEAVRAADDALGTVVYANRLAAFGEETGLDRDELEAAVDRLGMSALETAAELVDPSFPPAAAIALRRALLARHAGRDDVALRAVSELSEHPEYGGRADDMADEIRRRRGADARVVAVLLPLSGRFGALGAELRAAIELAVAGERARDDGTRLVFIDSGGTPEGAVAAVDAAVYRHRAVAILGPVGVGASAAAAARAAQLGATIALLTADAIPDPASGVFRLWTSGLELARATADAAIDRGYDSFAILAPRDEVGAAQAAAFAARVMERGRRVVSTGTYDPSATELEPDMRRFLNLDPARNRRLRAHLRKFARRRDGYATYSPDVPFDAIFIPDGYRRATLAVAYLPYFNVELRHGYGQDLDTLRKKHGGRIPQLVQLFGSAGWHHPGLFGRGGKDVEGALFADVWGGSPIEGYASGGAGEFAERFAVATGREPTAVAAQAYDAARLIIAARERVDPKRGDPRASMRRSLLDARLQDGACGSARVDSAGAIERDVLLLEVDSGEFALAQ